MKDAPAKKKTRLVKPKSIWLDEETIDLWESLSSPNGGFFDVVEESRQAIKARLKQIKDKNELCA